MASNRKKQSEPAKRLVIVISDKGGVGKSYFLVQLVEWLKREKPELAWRAWDPDKANKTLCSYHADDERVQYFDIDDSRNIDQIAACLSEVDLSIVDGRGSMQTEVFGAWMNEVSLMEILEEEKASLTFVHLVMDDPDVIRQAKEALDKSPSGCSHLVVRNRFEGRCGTVWDNSKTRAEFLKAGAIEVDLPNCDKLMSDLMHKSRLPVHRVVDAIGAQINSFERNRFRNLSGKVTDTLAQAALAILPASA